MAKKETKSNEQDIVSEEEEKTTKEPSLKEPKGAGLRFIKSKGACRICRRLGVKLFLKGEKCLSSKCPLIKRPYAPGQHGQKKTKLSDYGKHLMEKQKLAKIYGLKDNQIRNLIKKASQSQENTEEIIIQLLERRLDNVVYRLGWALSRRQARKLTLAGFFYVNGKKVDRPFYLVKPKDEISLAKRFLESKVFNEQISHYSKEAEIPAWLERKKNQARVTRFPHLEEVQVNIRLPLVIEFYKK